MTDDSYYRETPRFSGMQNGTNKEAIKNAALAKRGYLQMLLHAPLPLRSCADMDPPLTVRRLHSRGPSTLLDNAALVPTPLYHMSSLDSSIDRKKIC